MNRREYLTRAALEMGIPGMLAAEAVASTALAHPEWDLDEEVDPETGEPIKGGTEAKGSKAR